MNFIKANDTTQEKSSGCFLSPFYYRSSLCLDYFKEQVIRKHKKCAFLHNTTILGSDLEFPKQSLFCQKNKKADFCNAYTKIGVEPNTLWLSQVMLCGLPFLAKTALGRRQLQQPACTHLQCCSGSRSARLETDKYHVNGQNVQVSQ